ncbi:DUF1961 family protein [Carboxylicivirga sp. M1479]|uniref:DUF1961 family protein n=1 Tax=Carboxylicivirga sp. M1479 TaxID=2594476 RepID=UPI001177878D|nr:DUF1961 family protein [Carboxylicivirga sp. M1479]TRX71884.1 DUF1961 family protein [Carboxylicivirga sp. M1479]
MNKRLLILFNTLLLSAVIVAQQSYVTKLLYTETFDSSETLGDWQMEGPGLADLVVGQLLLQSKYAKETAVFLSQIGMDANNGVGYYNFVEELVKNDHKQLVESYYLDGNFVGGHIVFWNKMPTPDNYILEFDFQNLSDYPLHMLMFSHMGLKGESVFSSELKPRNGLAAQYTKSDMSGYRISFFAPERGTTHLRKSPEKQVLMKGKDLTLQDIKATHHMRVVKYKNTVIWQINGEKAFEYVETDETKLLKGGYFAFRLMVPAIGLYDNIKVYEIIEN